MTIRTWNEELPDTSGWRPRSKAAETLQNALLVTCQGIQRRLVLEAELERQFNIDNFDAGPGLEALVRRELAVLLPGRYSVCAGVVNDSRGATAGDCDVLVVDQHWAPMVKLPATVDARRVHFAIESLYAAIEVKQTATFAALDDAMKKLVTIARLSRPQSSYGQITENQCMAFLDRPPLINNPLLTIALFAGRDPAVPFPDLANRFFNINLGLERDNIVNILRLLDEGCAYYTSCDETGKRDNAGFGCDRNSDFDATLYTGPTSNAFYMMFTQLLGHVTRSVLRVQDLAGAYGPQQHPCRLLHAFKIKTET